jgi:hypothetical protein
MGALVEQVEIVAAQQAHIVVDQSSHCGVSDSKAADNSAGQVSLYEQTHAPFSRDAKRSAGERTPGQATVAPKAYNDSASGGHAMQPNTLEFLTEQLKLADQLLAGRDQMFAPQDLPGRYGRVVHAIDHLLNVMACESVLAGGWAVWHHGFLGRMTQDIEIVLPADRVEEFLRVAAVSGFEVLPQLQGGWPKVRHRDTDVKVDILPESERPGMASKPAPTTIPHPSHMGAKSGTLQYIQLPALIELKLAAGRLRDEYDVVELIRVNPDHLHTIRGHLATVHADYVTAFDRLMQRAQEQQDH